MARHVTVAPAPVSSRLPTSAPPPSSVWSLCQGFIHRSPIRTTHAHFFGCFQQQQTKQTGVSLFVKPLAGLGGANSENTMHGADARLTMWKDRPRAAASRSILKGQPSPLVSSPGQRVAILFSLLHFEYGFFLAPREPSSSLLLEALLDKDSELAPPLRSVTLHATYTSPNSLLSFSFYTSLGSLILLCARRRAGSSSGSL